MKTLQQLKKPASVVLLIAILVLKLYVYHFTDYAKTVNTDSADITNVRPKKARKSH